MSNYCGYLETIGTNKCIAFRIMRYIIKKIYMKIRRPRSLPYTRVNKRQLRSKAFIIDILNLFFSAYFTESKYYAIR